MTTETKIDPNELVYLGEDGQWLAMPGHVDLAAFTEAADARSRDDNPRLDDDELPSAYEEAYHTSFRPMTREWFDRSHPCDDAEYHAQAFDDYTREGAMEPCKSDDDGAEAWTLIGTGE